EPDRPVRGSGHQSLAVPADAEHEEVGAMVERPRFLPCPRIPQPDRAFRFQRDEAPAIRKECRREDTGGSGTKNKVVLPLHIPELDGPVRTAGGEQPTVQGAERHAPNALLMTAKRPQVLPLADAPELDRPIVAPRRKDLAVGTEGEGLDKAPMIEIEHR